LVHWPLMGGLLHLVQRRGAWAGWGLTQSPPCCTKFNSPPINGQCTNFILFDVAVKLPLDFKGLIGSAPLLSAVFAQLSKGSLVQGFDRVRPPRKPVNANKTSNTSNANIPLLVGRLGSGPSLAGRIRSGVRVSASVHYKPPSDKWILGQVDSRKTNWIIICEFYHLYICTDSVTHDFRWYRWLIVGWLDHRRIVAKRLNRLSASWLVSVKATFC